MTDTMDSETNYFTCTLGEAVERRMKGLEHSEPFRNVIQLIDEQARQSPETPAVGFSNFLLSKSSSDAVPKYTTFKELRDRSTCTVGPLSNEFASTTSKTPGTVGLLCTSSLDFILTWLGLMRLGHSVLFIAPQLQPQAIEHLCKSLTIEVIFADADNMSKREGCNLGARIVKVPEYQFHANPSVPSIKNAEFSDVAVIFHTSGTSTGLPKPIVQSHQAAVGAIPRFESDKSPATFSTTPLYHGGIADCFRAWTSGAMVWLFPEGIVPMTGANIVKAMKHTFEESPVPIRYFSSVPYVLQMLSEVEEGLNILQDMDLVGVGGAALPEAIGNRLVAKGINLVSRMGSTECGFLMSSRRDYSKDPEWQYLHPIQNINLLEFEARQNGLFELIVKPGWPVRSKENRDDGSYATSDLFETHPTQANAWRYHSRADAQITLANGKKFDPSSMEEGIRASSTLVRDVLIFGAGRDYAGALLMPEPTCPDDRNLVQELWPLVERMNSESQSHARLSKFMLVVIKPSEGEEPLKRCSKGTLLRRQAEERYAQIIEAAYEITNSISQPRSVSDDDLPATIADCFHRVLGYEVDPDQDLYKQGVDSTACIQIRKLVEFSCLSKGVNQLPLNVVYDEGTVNGLLQYIRQMRAGQSIDELNNADIQRTIMRELSEKYSSIYSAITRPTPKPGKAVVLTGATGFLGSHILEYLRQDQTIDEIYCFLRAKNTKDVHGRLSEALEQRKLQGLESYQRGTERQGKVICLPCDITKEDLGLDEEIRFIINQNATIFIHAAWAVNFNLRLKSFEDQIAGTRNLINMAVKAGARLFFISSTASVSCLASPIPEDISQDPSAASPLGYSQSKWIAESVCVEANNQLTESLGYQPIGIIRIGQLCGNSDGIWNAVEAYPLMLSTAKVTSYLPNLPNEVLNWMPVELAAKAILEIASSDQCLSSNNGDGKNVPLYHVANPHRSPTWKEMLEWILDENLLRPFDIMPPAEWLDRLESELQGSKKRHPSQALIGLWKGAYLDHPTAVTPATPGPFFDVSRSRDVSAAMRDLKPLDRERVLKMWTWVNQQVG